MSQTFYSMHDYYISHYGVKGMKWKHHIYAKDPPTSEREARARAEAQIAKSYAKTPSASEREARARAEAQMNKGASKAMMAPSSEREARARAEAQMNKGASKAIQYASFREKLEKLSSSRTATYNDVKKEISDGGYDPHIYNSVEDAIKYESAKRFLEKDNNLYENGANLNGFENELVSLLRLEGQRKNLNVDTAYREYVKSPNTSFDPATALAMYDKYKVKPRYEWNLIGNDRLKKQGRTAIHSSSQGVSFYSIHDYYVSHHGIKGQKWGIRRYQNPDGSLTAEGLARLHRATDSSQREKSKKLENTGYKTAAVGTLGTLGGSTALLAGVNPIIGGVGLGAGLLAMGVGSVMENVAAMRQKRNWNFIKKVSANYSKANPEVPASLVATLAVAGYDEMLKRPASDVVDWTPNDNGSIDVVYKSREKK